MPKVMHLDRVAMTHKKFGLKLEKSVAKRIIDALSETIEAERLNNAHRAGYSRCPNYEQETLIHEDGCMHCRSCG